MRKKQFKAESKRLLDLMVNSIYTHKEIFLREIISNASDAMDKLSYTALTDDKIAIDRGNLVITLTAAKDSGILTVSDNGIGMTRKNWKKTWAPSASPALWASSRTWSKLRISTSSASLALASTRRSWWPTV